MTSIPLPWLIFIAAVISLTIVQTWLRFMKRGTFNILLSLLLLVFFFSTAFLGIFWVAVQSLPVFEIHYLFGYVTVVLVILHVAVNWRSLKNFFLKQKAPDKSGSGQGRPSISATRNTLLTGVVCFLLGLLLGYYLSPTAISPVSVQNSQQSLLLKEKDLNLNKTTVVGNKFSEDTNMMRQEILVGQHKWFLADYYHHQTKHSRAQLPGYSLFPPKQWSRPASVYKAYNEAPKTVLSDKRLTTEISISAAIEARRRLSFPAKSLNLAQLASLLHFTNGLTAMLRYPGLVYELRAAPSAGALYPNEIYLYVNDIEKMKKGLYYYHVQHHELRFIKDLPDISSLADIVEYGTLIEKSPVSFFISGIYNRSAHKYKERAYRYVNLDGGHVIGNLTLAAAGLECNAEVFGAFDDSALNSLFELNSRNEVMLTVVPVGFSADDLKSTQQTTTFEPVSLKNLEHSSDIIQFMHSGTSLAAAGTESASHNGVISKLESATMQDLPKPSVSKQNLFHSIQKRRSKRNFTDKKVTEADFSAILKETYGVLAVDGEVRGDALPGPADLLDLYVQVNKVEGFAPGIYQYSRRTHQLSLVDENDQSVQAYNAALFQDVVRDAAVLFYVILDFRKLNDRDGDRGYRYACQAAGYIGETIYLAGEARGYGVCGIGAFFDGEVEEILSLNESQGALYMIALGAE